MMKGLSLLDFKMGGPHAGAVSRAYPGRIWMPLRVDGSALAPRTGPAVSIFGRLAPGASMNEAQAQLQGIAARLEAANPETHKNLRPRVATYGAPPAEGGEALVLTSIKVARSIESRHSYVTVAVSR